MTPEQVSGTQVERDGDAMRRLREAIPNSWTIEARGPIQYRHGVVDWEVEVCDSIRSRCDRGTGSSLADAVDRCLKALGMVSGR